MRNAGFGNARRETRLREAPGQPYVQAAGALPD